MASKFDAKKDEVKNSDRILGHVISRINSKINLSNDNKKQISEFILSRMTGGIKIEFVEELPDGDFEYAAFVERNYAMKSYDIRLAYGVSSEEKYHNILYVFIGRSAVNEVNIEDKIEESKNLEIMHDSNNELIRQKLLHRIRSYLWEFNIPLDEVAKDQIDRFLAPLVSGRVWVNFYEMPEDDANYQYTSVYTNSYMLRFAYGQNADDLRFPNVLYVSITKSYEAGFRDFWRKHYLPTCLLEEAIKRLDFSQQITIQVYERAHLWREVLESTSDPTVFGQEMNSEGQFNTRRPIGFVANRSFLVVTSPNEFIGTTGITYKFN